MLLCSVGGGCVYLQTGPLAAESVTLDSGFMQLVGVILVENVDLSVFGV